MNFILLKNNAKIDVLVPKTKKNRDASKRVSIE